VLIFQNVGHFETRGFRKLVNAVTHLDGIQGAARFESRQEPEVSCVIFEVFTAVTLKNAVFWDVAPCRSCVNRSFGGTYRFHLQDRKIGEQGNGVSRWLQSASTCSRCFLARRFFYSEDEGDTFLRNFGSHKIYTAPHPRRRHSSKYPD
jgi:hypothetical protein